MSVFKRNLLLGYGISLLLLVVSSVASYTSIQNLLYNTELLNHTNEVIKKLDAVASAVQDGETGQRGYLLTGDKRFLNPYHGANEKALQATQAVNFF